MCNSWQFPCLYSILCQVFKACMVISNQLVVTEYTPTLNMNPLVHDNSGIIPFGNYFCSYIPSSLVDFLVYWIVQNWQYPVGIYMFKANSRNTRTRCEMVYVQNVGFVLQYFYRRKRTKDFMRNISLWFFKILIFWFYDFMHFCFFLIN